MLGLTWTASACAQDVCSLCKMDWPLSVAGTCGNCVLKQLGQLMLMPNTASESAEGVSHFTTWVPPTSHLALALPLFLA